MDSDAVLAGGPTDGLVPTGNGGTANFNVPTAYSGTPTQINPL